MLYCSQPRLRIVEETGGAAGNFLEEDSATTPAFSGVSPLSGHVAWSRTKDRRLRLRPGSADTFTVEVLTTAITEGTPDGLCFSADGKRLLVGDYGRKKTWVLEEKN